MGEARCWPLTAGLVAQARGAEFVTQSNGFMFQKAGHNQTCEDAIGDVAFWLGFDSTTDYLSVLPKERADIFKRARKAPR